MLEIYYLVNLKNKLKSILMHIIHSYIDWKYNENVSYYVQVNGAKVEGIQPIASSLFCTF